MYNKLLNSYLFCLFLVLLFGQILQEDVQGYPWFLSTIPLEELEYSDPKKIHKLMVSKDSRITQTDFKDDPTINMQQRLIPKPLTVIVKDQL